ncbi:MAG: ATP-dependent Clp protease adaptor ClpS [Pirellulaceae bacterium]|nr:ATP-dependent Clp protease adaptor ClpS [Pirellulaceae bacterium]
MPTGTQEMQTVVRPRRRQSTSGQDRAQRQPRFQVILWNDEDHSFSYVVRLLSELFGYARTLGWQMANEVHYRGRVVLLTTTREHAELKRDQILAYGRDPDVRRCRGSMSATIEPLEN